MVSPVNENSDLPVLPPVDPLSSLQPAPDAVTPEAFAALLVDGDVDLATWALRVALSGRPRADVYDTLVHDAMRLVGENWSKGRWTISEEHLASQTLTSALAVVAPSVSPSDRIGPLAVVSCITCGEHSLGLITLEHVLREAGWSVANLRQDVPLDDLVRYATRMQARLVAQLRAQLGQQRALAGAGATSDAGAPGGAGRFALGRGRRVDDRQQVAQQRLVIAGERAHRRIRVQRSVTPQTGREWDDDGLCRHWGSPGRGRELTPGAR